MQPVEPHDDVEAAEWQAYESEQVKRAACSQEDKYSSIDAAAEEEELTQTKQRLKRMRDQVANRDCK
eukprot:5657558-Amphidinium_carterae.1